MYFNRISLLLCQLTITHVKQFALKGLLAAVLGVQGAIALAQTGLLGSTFVDDWGRSVQLPMQVQQQSALRIVSLAPHATEIIVAAGLQNRLVAVDMNSDFPLSIKGLPRLTSYPMVEAESLLATRANLLIVWGAGLDKTRLAKLEKMVPRVIVSDPSRPEDIARLWRALAQISDEPKRAVKDVELWEAQWASLVSLYRQRPAVSYVLQIWDQPLTVLSDQGLNGVVSKACSGRNVFDTAVSVAAQTDFEALVNLMPKVWFSTGHTADKFKPRAMHLMPTIKFFRLDESILQRPGPRWIDGVKQVCAALDAARVVSATATRIQ